MPTSSSSRKPTKRGSSRQPHRYKSIKLGNKRRVIRASLSAVALVLILIAWAVLARRFAPTSNTSRDHFDAILVLGTPSDPDGNPSPEELAGVTEGVREYERGVAPRLIFTGGAAHNSFVEAEVMAGAAAAQGIPPSAIFVETHALDTIQNACYSERLMKTHGWLSAEVISNAYHLPRSGLILSRTSLEWRTHAAPPLEPGESGSTSATAMETLKTIRYLVYANWAERCEP